jgi:hypothetical protein
VPFDASGSSRIRARLFVPFGILSQETAGDSLAPLQVYRSGNADPGARDATERERVPAGPDADTGDAGGDGESGLPGCCDTDVHPDARRNTNTRSTVNPDQRKFINRKGAWEIIRIPATRGPGF